MYCGKCGNKLNDNSKFCDKCGCPVDSNNQDVVKKEEVIVNKNADDKFDIVSLVLGIIAVILVLLDFPLGILVGIVGLVFGLITKKRDKIRGLGIGLNIASFVILSAIAVINVVSSPETLNKLYNELDYSSSDNYVAGTWNCSNFDGAGSDENYSITMKLNKDNTFVFGQYGDLSNNHAGGSYTFEDEKDKNESTTNGYKYFLITMNGNSNDYIVDGISQDRSFDSKFEIGITSVNTKKQAVLMNYYTYQMYYCYLEK